MDSCSNGESVHDLKSIRDRQREREREKVNRTGKNRDIELDECTTECQAGDDGGGLGGVGDEGADTWNCIMPGTSTFRSTHDSSGDGEDSQTIALETESTFSGGGASSFFGAGRCALT